MPIDMQRAPKMPTGKESDIESVTITVAENGGATVDCRFRQKPSKGDEVMPYMPSKMSAFSNVEEAVAFAARKLKHGQASDDDYDGDSETAE